MSLSQLLSEIFNVRAATKLLDDVVDHEVQAPHSPNLPTQLCEWYVIEHSGQDFALFKAQLGKRLVHESFADVP